MRALLDANVLFPTVLREILTDCAQAGLFTPLWSARILDEWRCAAARLGREQGMIAGAEAARLTDHFPAALIAAGDEAGLGVQLPDPGDLHVLRAAIDGRADMIVTANLRDFPARALAFYELRAEHPDAFLLALARRDRDRVSIAVDAALTRAIAAGGDLTRREMLSRSRLPRLQKFLAKPDERGAPA